MDRKQDLEQQLWELVYELLPEEDAVALRRRITSEPDVARAYAEVKLQSEWVAQATRYDADRIKFCASGRGRRRLGDRARGRRGSPGGARTAPGRPASCRAY